MIRISRDYMPESSHHDAILELDAYLQIAGAVITDGRRDSSIAALSLMAVVVRRFPPGDLRDGAEDILCSYIAEVGPAPDELAVIRRFRTGF